MKAVIKRMMVLRTLMALTALMTIIPLQAQVKIGQDAEPVKGAVLELHNNKVTGYVGGLKLPNVSIENVNTIPTGFSENSLNLTEQGNLTGAIVYNTNPSAIGGQGIGVYYWNGSKWIKDAPVTYTATNGLTLNGTAMELGGELIKNTTVDLNYYNLIFANSKSGFGNLGVGLTLGTTPASKVHIAGDLLMEQTGNLGISRIRMIGNGASQSDPPGGRLGILMFGKANNMNPYYGSGWGVNPSPHAYVEGTETMIGSIVSGTLRFGTRYDNSESIKMIIDGLGNVGIGTGTTAPTHRLHIFSGGTGAPVAGFKLQDGYQRAGYVLTSDANGVGTWQDATVSADNGLTRSTTGTKPIELGGTLNKNTTINTGTFDMIFSGGGTTQSMYFNKGNVSIGANINSLYKLYVVGQTRINGTTRIDNNLGIGLDPQYALHVQNGAVLAQTGSNAADKSNVWIGNETQTHPGPTYDSGGRLGVGVTPGTVPAAKIHVKGGSIVVENKEAILRMVSNATNRPNDPTKILGGVLFGRDYAMAPQPHANGYGSQVTAFAGVYGIEEMNTDNTTFSGQLQFRTTPNAANAVDRISMKIDGFGNVGIGSKFDNNYTNPTHTLHITTNGTKATPVAGFKLEDGTQTDKYVLTSDKDGVGTWQAVPNDVYKEPWNRMRTTEPSVNNTDSSYLMARVAIGVNQPAIIHKDHAQFTVVGGDASINGITVGTGKGNNNTNAAIGRYALETLNPLMTPRDDDDEARKGELNAAIGYRAGYRITTGNSNTMLNSWGNVTTGSGNLLIGRNATVIDETGNHQISIHNLICAAGATGAFFTDSNGKSTSDGFVGIGLRNPQAKFHIRANRPDDSFMLEDGNEKNDGYVLTTNAAGFATWKAPNSTPSDHRLKTNIVPSKYGLSEIMKLQPVNYEMKSNPGVEHVGFIAQDVKQVIPEVVGGKEGDLEKGETLSIAYSEFAPVLTKAIQEQQAQIETQQKLIEQLMARLKELEATK